MTRMRTEAPQYDKVSAGADKKLWTFLDVSDQEELYLHISPSVELL